MPHFCAFPRCTPPSPTASTGACSACTTWTTRPPTNILDQYIATRPQDPLPYAFRASAYLFYELDRLGILESEFLTDDNQIAEKKKKLEPDPATREKFVRAVHDVETRADAILKANPNDPQALFAMCIAQGVTTDYMAFVEKKQISSLSVAKTLQQLRAATAEARSEILRRVSDGGNLRVHDRQPAILRQVVREIRQRGRQQAERGVDRLRLVAREGHYFKPFSKILLSIIALREKRPQEAQQWLTELAQAIPGEPPLPQGTDQGQHQAGEQRQLISPPLPLVAQVIGAVSVP